LRDFVISLAPSVKQSRTLHTLTAGPKSGVHFMALSALSVSSADLATAQTFTIMGEGAVSCGTWLDQRKLGAETYGSWVLGYMTAASRYRDPARQISCMECAGTELNIGWIIIAFHTLSMRYMPLLQRWSMN
jgi:hypothetical protein